jgi:hypothetical protein
VAQTRSAPEGTERPPADHRQAGAGPTSLPRQPISPDQVDETLRTLPSNGWAFGWTGRRDRALLVLSQMAGLSFQAIAELTVADIAIADGVATIRTPGGATTLRSEPDGRICGPCALARWLHALDLTCIYPDPGVATAVISRAAPLTAHSPHLCEGGIEVCETTRSMPVLPRIDQWGPLAAGPQQAAAGSVGDRSVGTSPIDPVRLLARPVVTRRAELGNAGRPTTPAGTGKAALTQPGSAALAGPRIRAGSPLLPRHLGLLRSNYSRTDLAAQANPRSEQLADGLAGRARALLQLPVP